MMSSTQTDDAVRLAKRMQQISAETQRAVREANLAIKRTRDVVERAQQERKDDPDLAHVIGKVIP